MHACIEFAELVPIWYPEHSGMGSPLSCQDEGRHERPERG